MFSEYNISPNKLYFFISKLNKKNTLQVQTLLNYKYTKNHCIQRMSLFTSGCIGSITVETAIILPIFIFALVGLLSLGQLFIIDESINRGVTESARHIAKQNTKALGVAGLGVTFRNYVKDHELNQLYFGGSISKVSFVGSYYDDTEDMIYIKSSSKIKIAMPFLPKYSINLVHKIKQKSFTGYNYREDEVESDPFVYVTEAQTVYHDNRECTHLVLSIEAIYDVKGFLASNKKYKPCERCDNKKQDSVLYITKDGDAYHLTISCSGLKRTIRRIRKSEVGGLSLCQRCAQKT